MYEHILVPTDGSDGVKPAVEQAIDLAAREGATIHALYVIDMRIPRSQDLIDYLVRDLEKEGEKAVQYVVDQASAADVPVESTVDRGVPHQTILDYADTNGIDVIVMGTQGRTGLKRMMIGSVTEKVVRMSPIPVLSVKKH